MHHNICHHQVKVYEKVEEIDFTNSTGKAEKNGTRFSEFKAPAPSSNGWDKTGDMMLLSTSTRAPCA